jgi:hypothetical protein
MHAATKDRGTTLVLIRRGMPPAGTRKAGRRAATKSLVFCFFLTYTVSCILATRIRMMRLLFAVLAATFLFLAVSQSLVTDVAIAGPSARCCD